jgi:hypothetical protein
MIFLNIITPCSRPYNLFTISKSINIPRPNYRWIVVFDSASLPDIKLIPENCEYYLHKNNESRFGNAQRNYGMSLINNGHVYFNDDDTTIHPLLWQNINLLDEYDFISFKQQNKNGTHRLNSDKIQVDHIDSHNFIISASITKNHKFIPDAYNADGIFATKCFEQAKKYIHISSYLSIYNSLR